MNVADTEAALLMIVQFTVESKLTEVAEWHVNQAAEKEAINN